MSLFSDDAIADYSRDVSTLLTNYTLYNQEAFHIKYFGINRQLFNSSERESVFMQYQTDMNLLTNNGMENICSNSVGRWYTIDAIKTAFSRPLTYDILFALDKGIMDEPENTENTLKKKMGRAVAGVIIVQKGECNRS